ncbi:hypothetical protein GCM10009665_51870 [Kitasatospora nipponensis]|uniref:DUF2637 domain-containing protein n=1 Tax=Kitasatospora nipponensis TaxID=258049 RepID=A0ABN1WQG9_9ACTN
MVFFTLAGLLLALFAVDLAITFSDRERSEGSRWDTWNMLGYGPLFIVICLAMALDVSLEPGWSPAARNPVRFGLPVVVVVFGASWLHNFGRRLPARLRQGRGVGPQAPGAGPEAADDEPTP